MARKCEKCGAPSGYYPLCRNCWEKENVEVYYDELPTEGFDECVACGAATTGYAFCRKCFRNYTEEEMLAILNGEDDGFEELFGEEENKKEKKTANLRNTTTTKEGENTEETEENKPIIIDPNNKSKCITCGKTTEGVLFCGSCYHKYKDKELLFRITKCSSVELLDESYEGIYTCKDGHIVKSKSERDIDNYLFENGIPHAYEAELDYGGNANEILHPDFYLPDYLGPGKDVYIEHWGYNENNLHYTKTKKFKIEIYKKKGITLICTYEKSDSSNIYSALKRKLNKNYIKENEVNYEEN